MSLVLAMLLDALCGEPRWLWTRLPHPAVLMGRAIGWADARFNEGDARRRRGVLAFGALAVASLVLGRVLQAVPGYWLDVIICAILLAQRSLVSHVGAVANALRLSVGDGRLAVSMIVSRDTRAMDTAAVSRSAIESAAENLSDGVIAPAFWFLIGGLPALLLYKITNTADSMIGYRTQRHADFGWAAARFDDLLNLIPARLTAAFLWLAGGCRGSWRAIAADARLHRSPNAGWPEAALSRGLGVALAGPRSYGGVLQAFAYVNDAGRRDAGPDDIDMAIRHLWRAWAITLGGVLLFAAC